MSYNLRTALMYWLTLLFGTLILGFQVYKYFTNQLVLNHEEAIVTIVSVVLMRNPNILSNGLKSFINSKYNGKNDK